MWLLLTFPDFKRYQVENKKIKGNYRMTLNVADPPQYLGSARLNERVQLSRIPWSTSCWHQE